MGLNLEQSPIRERGAFLAAGHIPSNQQQQHIPGEEEEGTGPDPLAATPPLVVQKGVEEKPFRGDEKLEEDEEVEEAGGRRLEELKVQDLKNECKKRHLAVSGSKQQLMDRLRPFERQILLEHDGPAASSSPSSLRHSPQLPSLNGTTGLLGHSSVIDAVIDSVIDGSGLVEGKGAGARGAKKKLEWSRPLGAGGGVKKARQRGEKGTLADLLRGSGAFGSKLLFGERKGTGTTTVPGGRGCHCTGKAPKKRAQPKSQPELAGEQPSGEQSLEHVLAVSASLQPPQQPSQFEKMTFSFAQMGSGGQFTPLELAEISIGDIGAQNGLLHKKGIPKGEPLQQKAISAVPFSTGCPCKHAIGGEMMAAAGMPERRRQPSQIVEVPAEEEAGGGGGEEAVDPGGELMSAATLARHEEMLRQQQRKIVELQKELGHSQLGLQQHQQMVAEARKSAQQHRDPETGCVLGQAEFWVGQLEMARRQMDRAHMGQRELLDRQVAGHRALVLAEQRLQEELHTEQAVQDICRLIRQEPKAALLIVQLLRRYQLERSALPPVPMPIPPSEPLWNGFLKGEVPAEGTAVAGKVGVPGKGPGARKRTNNTRAEGPAGSKRAQAGRSNSVLDGLTATGGGRGAEGAMAMASSCACTARRPNSSLGTETAQGARSIGPVDMEEIFRSVLAGAPEMAGKSVPLSLPACAMAPAPATPFHSFVPIPDFLQHQAMAQLPLGEQCQQQQRAASSSSSLQSAMQVEAEGLFSQEMEKTMQDLMEVLRDDQESGQMPGGDEAPLRAAADFQTDQLATFLAEEVELRRSASGTASAISAVFPAQGQAMAVGSVRLGHEEEAGGGIGGTFGTNPADLLLFPSPEEAEKALDWLDGFDPFTAVF